MQPLTDRPPTDAAILAALYRDAAGALRLVMILRAERGSHAGQVALPGGRRDPEDPDLLATALREAHEEIGLDPASVRILGTLPVVKTYTNYNMHPYVGLLSAPPPAWKRQEAEIAEVFSVDVADLSNPDLTGEEVRHLDGWPEPRKVTYVQVGQHRLIGATLRVIRDLVAKLDAKEWDL